MSLLSVVMQRNEIKSYEIVMKETRRMLNVFVSGSSDSATPTTFVINSA
jgi:hypothetical protein